MTVRKAKLPTRPIWSGRISIGLVNIPVKIFTMIRDESFSFRYVRKEDACPLKYQRVCTLDREVVDWAEVARGYEVRKGEFVVFDKEELDALRPSSDGRLNIDKFVPFSSIDRIYFDKTYLLSPDRSEDAYALMLSALEEMSMAGVGKFIMRTKEYPMLLHPYKRALVLTTLRYSYEVVDPQDLDTIRGLEQPSDEELNLATKIIENLSGEFDINEYRDTFRDKVEDLIEKKMKGETIIVEEPEQEEVKELMEALQETLKQLQE